MDKQENIKFGKVLGYIHSIYDVLKNENWGGGWGREDTFYAMDWYVLIALDFQIMHWSFCF